MAYVTSKSTSKSLGTYVKEHFPNAAYGVYPVEDDSKLAIIIVGNKYSPNNFWYDNHCVLRDSALDKENNADQN